MGTLLFFFILSISICALQRSNCATVVVDGVSKWSDPTANIGDTIIFKHQNHYNLYIFRTKEAFNTCNFTQATPLSNPNSTTFTWHPSRPGNFFFSFYNGTTKPCQEGQKLAIQITPRAPPAHSPENPVNPPENPPPATPGGVVSSSPSYPWPFKPRERDTPVAGVMSPSMSPAMSPDTMPGSIPFINSNPAVPLPTGEVDSATIRPLPTASANHAPALKGVKVVGLIQGLMICLCSVIMVVI